ncbi:MAG: hypothetical protein HC848_08810 [Limnobacter sp.]|nr:hypothetical protein [Limnobacter sp.]
MENKPAGMGVITVLRSKAVTVRALFGHFMRGKKLLLLPLLVLLLLSGILLMAAGGLSYVAPFVYAIV